MCKDHQHQQRRTHSARMYDVTEVQHIKVKIPLTCFLQPTVPVSAQRPAKACITMSLLLSSLLRLLTCCSTFALASSSAFFFFSMRRRA